MLGAHEKPDVTYADVGGLDMQKQEIREAVELPLTQFDLYKQIGNNESTQESQTRANNTRYRSAPRSSAVWASWYWQNHVGESGSEQHNGKLHQGSRI